MPGVELWIDDLHRKHRSESVPASDTGFARLAACFPADLLTSTRVVLAPKIPFPPVSDYGLPEFEEMGRMPLAGITFGDMYFVHPSHASEGTHFHELLHVVQWRTLGARSFLLTYAVGLAQSGYRQSPLEAIAFELQSRFEAGWSAGSVVELVARDGIEARNAAAALFAGHALGFGG